MKHKSTCHMRSCLFSLTSQVIKETNIKDLKNQLSNKSIQKLSGNSGLCSLQLREHNVNTGHQRFCDFIRPYHPILRGSSMPAPFVCLYRALLDHRALSLLPFAVAPISSLHVWHKRECPTIFIMWTNNSHGSRILFLFPPLPSSSLFSRFGILSSSFFSSFPFSFSFPFRSSCFTSLSSHSAQPKTVGIRKIQA